MIKQMQRNLKSKNKDKFQKMIKQRHTNILKRFLWKMR